MIAVTVVTPSYRHLEKEAVRRVKKFTGLPVKVIRCKDKDGFFKKLELDKECGRQRVLFFDCDLWLTMPIDFKSFDPTCFFAVHDAGIYNPQIFPRQDCDLYKMDMMRYFNSGLMLINFSIPEHRKVFQKARLFARQVKSGKLPKPFDKTDQLFINMGVQSTNPNLSLLPQKFNYYHFGWEYGQIQNIPRGIIGLHAAGVLLKDKLSALQDQERVLCNIKRPMWPDAISMMHAKIFEM